MLHVHEPLTPGPSMTTLTLHAAPIVGTFHAAGRSTSYRMLAPALRALLGRVDQPGRRLQGRPGARAGVSRRRVRRVVCSTVSRRPRSGPRRRSRARGRRSSSSAATRSARVWRSCCRRCRCSNSTSHAGSPATARHRPAANRARRRPADRVAGPDLRGRQARPAPWRLGVLRAVAPRRVVRRRVGRGDGGRHTRGRQRASPATATSRPTGSTRCSSSPAIPTSLAAALEPGDHATATRRFAASPRPARRGPMSSRCRGWPTRTSRSTRTARLARH